MKIYFSLVLILLFSIFSFGQSNEKESILILSVNFHTTTIISVPCENFTIQFDGQIKINKVNAKDSIAILDKFLESIRFLKNGREINVDTRAKIIYKNKVGKEVIICTDGFNLLVNGRVVRRNKPFIKFILSLIPEEQQAISFTHDSARANVALMQANKRSPNVYAVTRLIKNMSFGKRVH